MLEPVDPGLIAARRSSSEHDTRRTLINIHCITGGHTDPFREIDTLPFANDVYLTIADSNTQTSYWITPGELVSVRASGPSAPGPAGYGCVAFSFKMTVQGGQIVKFEQIWTP